MRYKEEGHYPDVPEEIKETPNVLNEKELEDREDNWDTDALSLILMERKFPQNY